MLTEVYVLLAKSSMKNSWYTVCSWYFDLFCFLYFLPRPLSQLKTSPKMGSRKVLFWFLCPVPQIYLVQKQYGTKHVLT